MGTLLGNRSHCSRALRGRATLCGAANSRRSLAIPFLHRCRAIIPGSTRVSRVGDDVSSSQTFLKIVSARRRNQHASSQSRARDFLGSAGCEPAVDGSLPATFRRIHGTVENQSRQAAETYRLAACAPQNPEGRFIARTLRARSARHARMRALRRRNGVSR